MVFRDRTQAGNLLARELRGYPKKDAVVLGIPRGGVVVAMEVARHLGVGFDIILSRKIGAPANPEYAVGSVNESGDIFLDEHAAQVAGVNAAYVAQERERQMSEIKRRVSLYRPVHQKASLQGKLVIITDDGIATGLTAKASVRSARKENPAKIVVAVPVAPEDALRNIADYADETLCLCAPPLFYAVGQFYETFNQVTDEELAEMLKQAKKTGAAAV